MLSPRSISKKRRPTYIDSPPRLIIEHILHDRCYVRGQEVAAFLAMVVRILLGCRTILCRVLFEALSPLEVCGERMDHQRAVTLAVRAVTLCQRILVFALGFTFVDWR